MKVKQIFKVLHVSILFTAEEIEKLRFVLTLATRELGKIDRHSKEIKDFIDELINVIK